MRAVMRKLQHKTSTEPIFITRQALAQRWTCSQMTLKRRESDGILLPLKLGKAVRYRIAQIEEIERQAEVRIGGLV